MFAYNPTVNDRSGEILGRGLHLAAAINAEAMSGLGQNIGNALASIGGTIGGMAQQNAAGDSAFEALRAIGEMYPGMKKTFGALEGMDPRTRRLASLSIIDNLGAISQLGIAGMRDDASREARALTAALPGMRNAANTAATVAGGGGTVPLQDSPADYAPMDSPGTGALQAAGAWYNQRSSTPTSMSQGAMKPFWKK